jgi:sugar lactone lactonase YvrE
VDDIGFDLGSHLDMLHDTPLCMGIAWEDDRVYWTFDGWDSLSRQDFKDDHGPGYDDHSDGEILRYVEGEVERLEDVPSHLAYDPTSQLLYVADTGNGRIAVLDTTTGTMGERLPQVDATPYPVHNRMDDAVITTFYRGELEEPSGLALYDGYVWVSDHATGLIAAYDMKGTAVDWVNVEPGIMGIAFGPDGSLYYANAETNEVVRMRPLEE